MRARSLPFALGCGVASALLPGAGQALQGRWRRAALFGLPTLVLVALAIWAATHDQTTLLGWSVDDDVLRNLSVGGVLWGVLCAVAAGDAALAAWPRISNRAGYHVAGGVFVVVVVLATLPGLAGAFVALRQDTLLETVFTSSSEESVAVPSPLSDLGVPPSTATTAAATKPANAKPGTAGTTAPTKPRAPAGGAAGKPTPAKPAVPTTKPAAAKPAAPAAAPGDRWNIALLGGDAGPYRWGLRTDTMIVVSIDRATGDLASVSVPRNLRRLPMPPGPLRKAFPRGFDDLANAVYTYVSLRPQLGIDPAAAVKGGLAELLGIPIHNYVLVDMTGFVKIIDALGGVTVNVPKRVPLPPNMDRRTREARYVGPGPVRMNGAMALAFVRTRQADSDYERMKRQRCMLASVARSTSPVALAKSYPRLAQAVEQAFRSDIPRSKLAELVQLFAKVDVDQARTLVLVPPVIQPGKPDIAKVRSLVAATINSKTPEGPVKLPAGSC
jgi:LCP family protein required for cell wall assembly